tara:strand:+ start:51 stop:695 length:645 start_codon:yes stop_codon:yes gene_type:complete
MASSNFWTTAAPGQRDPKRNFRFVLYNGNIPQWIVKSVKKPSFSVETTTHQYINHTFNYPGRVTWNDVDLTLVDPVSPDAAQTMMSILSLSGYHPPSNSNDISTMCKSRAVNALGDVRIDQIDSDGNTIESWKLQNAWVASAEFGSLDYTSDDLSEITLTLKYDFAVITTLDGPDSGPLQDVRTLPANYADGAPDLAGREERLLNTQPGGPLDN